jgi:hypothetical protein
MKIKSDFVTNSSSTSYIYLIPDLFDVKNFLSIKEQAGYLDNLIEEDLEDEERKDLVSKIIDIFDSIKKGNSVDIYMEDCEKEYMAAYRLVSELNMEILSSELSGGNGSVAMLISESFIQKQLSRIKKELKMEDK